jgi:hypothetical protein
MKKLTIIKTVNAGLFLSFLIQALTGVMLAFNLGGGAAYEVHEINGYIMIILVAAHLFLFWPMVKQHYFAKKS